MSLVLVSIWRTYAARYMVSLRDFFTDDVVWHVAGKHPLSGDYRGKDSLVGYSAALTR